MKRKILALIMMMLMLVGSTMTVCAESSSMDVSLGDGSGPGGTGGAEFEGNYIVSIPATVTLSYNSYMSNYMGNINVNAYGDIPLTKEFYFTQPANFNLTNSADNTVTCSVATLCSKNKFTSEDMYNSGVALNANNHLDWVELMQLGAASVVNLNSSIFVPGHYEGTVVITYGIRNAT